MRDIIITIVLIFIEDGNPKNVETRNVSNPNNLRQLI